MRHLIETLYGLCGCHADELLRLLTLRDGEPLPDAWLMELEGVLDRWGSLAPEHDQRPSISIVAGRKVHSYGSTSAGACLVWAQHIRLQCKLLPVSFSSDPAWVAQSRRLHASVDRADQRLTRRRVARRYGLESSTHIPASCLARSLDLVLLENITAKPSQQPASRDEEVKERIASDGSKVITAWDLARRAGSLRFVVQAIMRSLPLSRVERLMVEGIERPTWCCAPRDLPLMLAALDLHKDRKKTDKPIRGTALAAPAPSREIYERWAEDMRRHGQKRI